MKTIKVNGVTINLSEAEYKKYMAAQKKLNTLSIEEESKSKSGSTIPEEVQPYIIDNPNAILLLSDACTVAVCKNGEVAMFIHTWSKGQRYALKQTAKEYGAKYNECYCEKDKKGNVDWNKSMPIWSFGKVEKKKDKKGKDYYEVPQGAKDFAQYQKDYANSQKKAQ